MADNNDLIEPLLELEYLIREGVIFSEDEWNDITKTCECILKHRECPFTIIK